MARKYILGIDETGSFRIQGDTQSFVCGVMVSGNELELKTSYQRLYEDFGFPAPTPTKCTELLQEHLPEGKEGRFHANRLTKEEREKCLNRLKDHVGQVFVSTGMPALYANNQNWWLIALVVVIRGFLQHTDFEPDAEIEVWIDCRKNTVWGVLESDRPEHNEYHDTLKKQIRRYVEKNVRKDCKLSVNFNSDTSNFFINLADITCGLIRNDKKLFREQTTKCYCQSFTESTDPLQYIEKSPLTAFSLIMQEIANDQLSNALQIQNVFGKLRKEQENYVMAWDMFHDMLKYKIDERSTASHIVGMKPIVDEARDELAKPSCPLPLGHRMEMMTLITEYYSHIGSTEFPFPREEFIRLQNDASPSSETRLLRRWEKLLSYSLREAQLLFNNYRFDEAKETYEKLYSYQDRLINSLPMDIYEEDTRKDEPTTALLGTLAQAYAYEDELETAIEYFNLSKDYAIRTQSTTESYLCNIYHRMLDLDNCRISFAKQTGYSIEEYADRKDFSNQWTLLNYCKICALDWHLNQTSRMQLPIDHILNCSQEEYPFPLIQKWAALVLMLQDKQKHKATIERLFEQAIQQLLKKYNGFAIRTLALPIILCYAEVNNKNPYHSQYDKLAREMKAQSDGFKTFVEQKVPILQSVKCNANIWEKAMALPFIYS